MCGIGGVLALGERPPDPQWASKLVECLAHRGPDGHGGHADERIVLAHTRLAIIDLSAAGAQPMTSADGRHRIVVNGEIYNYEALRAELEREGMRFRSHSDIEVLLELLARDGVAALERVRGMFALAWWNEAAGELVLARDRLGKKPLYVAHAGGYFGFASEAHALLELPFVGRRLDRARVADYLRYLYVPAPHTLIEGLHKLPAGSYVRLRAGRDEAIDVRRWWRLSEPDPEARPDREWFDDFEREFLESVRLRTVSDVPIGVFLSGGVDSNLVLDGLARIGHAPIRTFTVGFGDGADERPLARLGAAGRSHEHVELVLAPDLARDVPGILDRFADPLGDSAVVTTALISREAAKHVKVVLNGDGGDELCGGYPRYPFARRADLAANVPPLRALLAARVRARPAATAALDAAWAGDFGKGARILGSVTPPSSLAALLREAAPSHAEPELPGFRGHGLTGAMFAWDSGVYLPDDLLYKADAAAMASGLENRSPLLDHRLFEHVGRLPFARRADPLRTKPLLRRFARGRIPLPVLDAKKQGFQLPLERWLRGPLSAWLDGLLLDPQATGGLFREGALRADVEGFRTGAADDLAPYRLWGIAALEHWARRFAIEIGA